MPYSLRGNYVYKGEEKLKCFNSHKDALAYFRALKANVEDSIHEFSMVISKSSLYDGEMRWSAVNSDTDWDLYGERMSLELYKSMISKIKSNVPPPEPFAELVTSEYWKGGMPYLSIAHYSDGNGKAVPGEVRQLFIDGSQLKAKGILYKNSLGLAVWKSLKEDEINYKNVIDIDRIRISIAFLDLAHKHGEDGQTFRRKSFSDVCPECKKGIGDKIYLDGYLVHLALTRVPVNPRTIMEVDEIMAKKAKIETKKDDAVSIVGEEEATKVEASALETKSDVLVEMSDTDSEIDTVSNSDATLEIPEVSEVPLMVSTGETVVDPPQSLETIVASLVAKAMKEYKEKEEEEDEKEKKETEKKSLLDVSVEKLYNSVNGAISKAGTSEAKLQEIQPVLEELGQAIVTMVKSSVGEENATTPAPANDAVLEAIQSLANQVKEFGTELATLRAQTEKVPQGRVPAPRSISASIVKSDIPKPTDQPVNPNSVRNIVRRSVNPNMPPVVG